MKYPYIGEWKEPGLTVLFVANCEGFEMGNAKNYQRDWSEGEYTNITHEYLQNTYGEVQSPEHAEFIIELGKNANATISTSWLRGKYFNFYTSSSGELHLDFYDEQLASDSDERKITIPLSPKVETLKNAGDNLILGCEDSKCDEWLQVGDEVEFPTGRGVLIISKPDEQGIVIVESLDDEIGSVYKRVSLKAIKKPKSAYEKLRDELIDLAHNQFNDNRFDLSHNSYYLVSDLMDKYDIKPR